MKPWGCIFLVLLAFALAALLLITGYIRDTSPAAFRLLLLATAGTAVAIGIMFLVGLAKSGTGNSQQWRRGGWDDDGGDDGGDADWDAALMRAHRRLQKRQGARR